MRQHKMWTDEEYGFLEDHADWTNAEVGEALGRNAESISNKRRELRHGIERTVIEQWTEDEDDFVRATPHLTAVQIAATLGRSVKQVEHRRSHLKASSDREWVVLINKEPTTIGARPLLAKTCPDCGLLLAAKWYAFEGVGRTRRGENWSTKCRKCRHVAGTLRRGKVESSDSYRLAANRSYRSRQDLTRAVATNNGNPYTETDHKVLADPDLMNIEKAVRLGRSLSAIMGAVRKYEYRSRRGLGDSEKEQWHIDNPNEAAA